MLLTQGLTFKVCLVGEEAVGKTSLVRRFTTGLYSDDYLKTIGALVTKKTLTLKGDGYRPTRVTMMIWDIMGRRSFLELVGEAYLHRSRGALAVCDLSRVETIEGLKPWIEGVRKEIPNAPVLLLANKVDLVSPNSASIQIAKDFASKFSLGFYLTSAKTGESVDKAFFDLAMKCASTRVFPR